MEYTKFVRRPFTVEAVEVTKENIAEISNKVGELKDADTDNPWIDVNRNLVPNVTRVAVGYWMTKMGNHIRCYTPGVFKKQFAECDEKIDELLLYLKKPQNITE